jgi:signal transduction histidine kinase
MIRLFRSTSVQLALGYAGLFVASSLLLVGLLWWGTAGYLARETAAVIRSDVEAIQDRPPHQGFAGAIDSINDRVGSVADGHATYLLADGALKAIAGNLAVWPAAVKPKAGWYQVVLSQAGQYRATEMEEVALPGGYHLLVGRDVQDRAQVRALIVTGLSWAAIGALVIAMVGGLWVRRTVLRRVEIINSTVSAIMHGDLSRRLPTRDTSDEFDQLAQTINFMLGQIGKLIEGIRNTSNTVAHDLRTPLTELRAELEEMIRLHPSRVAMVEGVHKAVADIDRVIAIFNALLRLAEIDSGVRRSGFRRVDVAKLATEVAELYGPLTEDKDATFALDAHSGSVVNGDPYLLAQAVGNLVDNAVKYAPRQGTVSLRTACSGDGQIEITVEDDGPGIADAEKPRVTERFYRCLGQGRPEGIGLGLSLVEAVARLHNGELALRDNDPGLSATLRLPAENADVPADS